MVSTATQRSAPKTESTTTHALLFELDTVIMHGRDVLYDATRKAFSNTDLTIDEKLFTLHCLDASPRHYVRELLARSPKSKASDTKMAEDILQAYSKAVAGATDSIPAPLRKVIDHARSLNFEVAGLSTFGGDTLATLAARVGINDPARHTLTFHSDTHLSPTAHEWLRLTKQIGIRPNACVAIVGSLRSCRAALVAGVHPVVLTDRFTAFQDYGGADYVAGTLTDAAAKDIMELINHRNR